MPVVKIENKTYTAEPLYQWDQNRVLEIYGLSFDVVPEVHFTNDSMARALCVSASVDAAGVIRANIPNSLLQTTFSVKAYICTLEGDRFKTWYTIVIPVKPRSKPADYTLTHDSEVYSFVALENQINGFAKEVADTVAVVNAAVQTAEAAAEAAGSIAGNAEAARELAEAAGNTAAEAKTVAEGAAVKSLELSLLATGWTGDASPYSQAVTLAGYETTANTRVDITPSPEVITQAMNDGFALVIENNNGAIIARAIGEKPTADLIVQVGVLEVLI